jgi:hypothetical protein
VLALAATLAASATFAVPVAVGPTAPPKSLRDVVSVKPDPIEGAWLKFTSPGGEQLFRIHEDGRIALVRLPSKLHGEELEVTPLASGWTVATDRVRPDGELVVATRSPSGRWTKVQPIPHSFGRDSGTAVPVEDRGLIELAWSEGESLPIWVAVAHPGRPFGPAQIARSILHGEAKRIDFFPQHGALYLRGEYGPESSPGKVTYWVDRRLHGDGTLGPPHFLRSPALNEPGAWFEGANGWQFWVYEPPGGTSVLLSRRRMWAPTFEAARLVAPHSAGEGSRHFAQSQNHRTLMSLDTTIRGRSRISAVEISPDGEPGPLRGVELEPTDTEYALQWDSAVTNTGGALIATRGENRTGQIWLHPSSPRCPSFHGKLLLTSASNSVPSVSAGPRGIFHLAWVDALNQAQITSARVGCAHKR